MELKDDDFENYAMQANIYLFQDKPEKMPMAIEALTHAIETYKPEETHRPQDLRARLPAAKRRLPEDGQRRQAAPSRNATNCSRT